MKKRSGIDYNNRLSPMRTKTKDWFSIRSEEDATDILIYDAIDSDWGLDAQDLVKAIRMIKSKIINVFINSPGGNVFDGFAIFNALNESPSTVNVQVDGIAASIASIIALAGDHVAMASNAMLMIHNPWTTVQGDSRDLSRTLDVLEKLRQSLLTIYVKTTGIDDDAISTMMDEETWFTADEALSHGFISEVLEQHQINNYHDLSVFNNAPDGYSQTSGIKFNTPRDLEHFLRKSGVSRSEALRISSAHNNKQDHKATSDNVEWPDELGEQFTNLVKSLTKHVRANT